MYEELHQYLLQYKNLPVPGIGTFLLVRQPASIDFTSKLARAPKYTVVLQPTAPAPSTGFFSWLASRLQVSDREAVIRFNDFVFDFKKQVQDGAVIHWNAVGTLQKNAGETSEIVFTAATHHPEETVTAEKVLRQKAEHMVRVGEDERTSVQMKEMLSQKEEKKNYWWAYALIVALLTIVYIGWYFSQNGVSMTATGNHQKISPKDAPASYKILP